MPNISYKAHQIWLIIYLGDEFEVIAILGRPDGPLPAPRARVERRAEAACQGPNRQRI